MPYETLENQIPGKIKTSDFVGVLSNPGFLLLWLAQLFSQLADRLYVYILMILAFRVSNSNLGISIPLLAFGIPSVLFGPLAGLYVDQWPRKWILVFSSLIRGIIILFAIPLVAHSLWMIFLVSFLVYTSTQFFAPAETASMPELVEKHNLIIANSLFMITWMASSVIGFGLGAPVVAILHQNGTLVSSGMLYVLAALAAFFVPLRYRRPETRERARALYLELARGFVYIWRNQIIKYALLKLFVTTMAIAAISLLAIPYAEQILKIGAENFGYLIITTGLGMLVGLFTLHRLTDKIKKGTLVIGSFLASGLLILLLPLAKTLPAALFLTFILGIGNIYLTSTIQTILQHHIHEGIRGRVFGVQNMLINSAFTFPVVLFGLTADTVGVGPTLVVLGILVFAMGVAGIFLPKFKAV